MANPPQGFNPAGQGTPPPTGPNQAPYPVSGPPESYAPPSVQQGSQNGSPQNQSFTSTIPSAAPQLPPAQASTPLYSSPPTPIYAQQTNHSHSSLPPLKPVFGVSLEDLLKRDGSAIPMVIYQCIQAVDLFGLDVEGIYRLSGSAAHVSKLKAQFDHGRSCYRANYFY